MNDQCCTKLSVMGLGLAFGITWAIGILLMGLGATFFHWGNPLVTDFGSVYVGYEATILGSLIGTLWALVDGFICGVLVAFFYNLYCKCCKKS